MLFQCPVCSIPIIGEYRDLVQHIMLRHPSHTRLINSAKSARSTCLCRRIEEEMVVDEDQ